MRVPIRQLGRAGLNKDLPSYNLDPNAWTDVKNGRMFDNDAWRCFGYQAVYGVPLAAPRWLLPVSASSGLLWLYAANTAVYATDGTTHADITRTVGGAYTAGDDDRWNGGLISTGLAVVNNGKDVPQMWNGASLAQPLAALTAFPASTTAKVIRPFKRFLIAMDVTKSAVRYGQLIKWSNQAQAGAFPTTWDNTDPTQDAREWPLLDSDGIVIDGGQLGDYFVIYKEDQTHLMEYIGGTFVFKFSLKFKESGILAQQCYTEYEGKHVVATTTDVVVHDGFQMTSLLDDRMRRWWAGRADPTYAKRSFMIANLNENEIWVGIPEAGSTFPNIALIINMKEGTTTVEELPNVAHMALGVVDPSAGAITYDAQTKTFDQMVGQFGQRNFNVGSKRMLMAVPLMRRNLLLRSDDISNASWTKTNVTLGATVTNPRGGVAIPLQTESVDGGGTQHLISQSTSTNVTTSPLTWTVNFDAKGNNANRKLLLYVDDGAGAAPQVSYRVDPNTGTVTSFSAGGSFSVVKNIVRSLGSGFYSFQMTFINNNVGTIRCSAYWTNASGNDVYTGTGIACGYVGNVSLRQGRGAIVQTTAGVAASSALLLQDQETLRDGEGYQSYFERIGLTYWSIDRRGQPVPDMEQKKLLKEIWPQVQVQGITSINVYAGAADQLEDPIQWTGPFVFTPGVDDKIDCEVEGRLLAVKFECPDITSAGEPNAGFFKLNGYDYVAEPIGSL